MLAEPIRVAVGVIEGPQGILIARRQKGQHLEGLWEFPGGKVEVGEEALDALSREILEETQLHVGGASFLFDIRHDYPEKTVILHIFHVTTFTGDAQGHEGQEVRWAPRAELDSYDFPEANQAILDYLLGL